MPSVPHIDEKQAVSMRADIVNLIQRHAFVQVLACAAIRLYPAIVRSGCLWQVCQSSPLLYMLPQTGISYHLEAGTLADVIHPVATGNCCRL